MRITNYLQKNTSAAPLAVFRVALGLLLFAGVVRFWANGWIYELYIEPRHHFTFYGFEFIQPLGVYTYVLFAVCGIASLLVSIGLYYRYSSIALFLSFTYIELIDKTTYLNHYYFISMVCLMMIFLPAHAFFSVDAYRNATLKADRIPRWTVDSLKLFIGLVYVCAGLAKINSDWLLEAQPLRTWLPAKNDLPLIGFIFNHLWVAYVFSWLGCLYDLSIPFLLLGQRTRPYAYAAVIVFHVLTAILFPIGMFPYVMMATALIFFSPGFHWRVIRKIGAMVKISGAFLQAERVFVYPYRYNRLLAAGFGIFFILQLALPFRHILYPGELFWTEEGYRFSWRVMLMEKAGYAQFMVRDVTGKEAVVNNQEFLTTLQEKMMATQPDMILQYAHILRDHFVKQGFQSPQVYVESYVALNGRLGKPLIDPATDLANIEDSFSHKPWILAFENEIKGL